MPTLPRAVLFDFDGTLADSYDAITASTNHVRAARALPPLPDAEVRRHVGRGLENLLAECVPDSDLAENVALYRAHHETVMRELTQLLPGAREAIEQLHRAGCRLGVCSNKKVDFTRELLDYLGLTPHLDVVLGPDDVPRPKPAPDMLQEALRRLGVAPAEALYVGDMGVDVETARAAGVPVWVVPTGSSDRATLAAAGPDRLLDDLHAVARALLS